MTKHYVLRNISGTAGILMIWQALLACVLMEEQLLWSIFPSEVFYENSANGKFHRASIFDYEHTSLLMASCIVIACVIFQRHTEAMNRILLIVSLLCVILYWTYLFKNVFFPSPETYLFTGRFPPMNTDVLSTGPGDTSEIEIRLRADPLFHICFWAALGQTILALLSFNPHFRDKRLGIIDVFLFMTTLSVAFAVGMLLVPAFAG